jgi:hypothetical protein
MRDEVDHIRLELSSEVGTYTNMVRIDLIHNDACAKKNPYNKLDIHNKIIEYKKYIAEYGEDISEILK